MKRLNVFLAVLLIIVHAGSAAAATLHGKIYDIELNELNDVIVEVDSEPAQRYVSKDGSYSPSSRSGQSCRDFRLSQPNRTWDSRRARENR